jgi:predicted dehydrogenase
MTRKEFLGSLSAPFVLPARAVGSGGRIAIGIIGAGQRAVFEARHLVPIPGCEIVAVCDVQETRRVEAAATFEKLYAERDRPRRGIRQFHDYRELLRQPDIDAVYIATPDHWHVPILVAALKAGKACHCEKPLGVSIQQDQAALRAVRKYGRPFFYGPELRSLAETRHAVELVLNGRIGKVKEIWVAAPPSKAGGSTTPVLPVPKGFDWDMWLGPAPEAPFCADRLGEGIFHIRDYCLGFIANWGIHPLDLLQWWADNAGVTVPLTYEGRGEIAKGGLYNCATRWDLRCTYENGLVLRYMDGFTFNERTDYPAGPPGPAGKRGNNATVFAGTEGTVAITYQRVLTEPASLVGSPIGPNEIRLVESPVERGRVTGKGAWEYPAAAHQLAWIESLRAGKPGVHSIETAVRANLVCHLSDICVRTGRAIRWDPQRQAIAGDSEAAKMMSRPMRKPWDVLA